MSLKQWTLLLIMTRPWVFLNSPLSGTLPEFHQHLSTPKARNQGALSSIFCPQSAIHGWSGLAIDPTTYLLLESTPFVVPVDPGAVANNPQWAAPTTIKMIDGTFLHDKNYFSSYKNIARACFCMFDVNIATQFKVSNTPLLTG
jgi:hypothetical protein